MELAKKGTQKETGESPEVEKQTRKIYKVKQ